MYNVYIVEFSYLLEARLGWFYIKGHSDAQPQEELSETDQERNNGDTIIACESNSNVW